MPFPALPIDPAAQLYQKWLAKIQGNIVKPHGRDYVRLLFFRFRKSDRRNRGIFPRAIERKLITSAWQQHQDAPARSLVSDREFYSVGLSNSGLWACGYRDEDFPPDPGAFTTGQIRTAVNVLNDPPSRTAPARPSWDPEYRAENRGIWAIHGIWLLAHAQEEALDAMEKKIAGLLAPDVGDIVAREPGFRWRDAANPKLSREPFGFVDGISGPKFFRSEWPGGRPPPSPWSAAPLDQILIDEPGPHEGGSFLVYRKLDQNVQALRKLEARLATELKARSARPNPPPLPEDPAALLVGRERDGTPLAFTASTEPNDFDFRDRNRGDARCPFHAHIRKVNPREPVPGETEERNNRQFVRRSAVYDPDGQLPEVATAKYEQGDRISGNVGLLFMAYMRSISGQFERIHRDWIGDADFPQPAARFLDPLLVPDAGGDALSWSWQGASLPAYKRVVTARGGGYFYVPPMTWLAKPPVERSFP